MPIPDSAPRTKRSENRMSYVYQQLTGKSTAWADFSQTMNTVAAPLPNNNPFLPEGPPLPPLPENAQDNWRWCQKCQGLYFNGSGSSGHCPAGGPHDATSSGDYVLFVNHVVGPGQSGWRWCNKCQGLYFNGSGSSGHCPAGGVPSSNLPHDATGSGDYAVYLTDDPGWGQLKWRWCHKCQGLHFIGNGTVGPCPADGGSHSVLDSGNYALPQRG
jgi:hypothetical protein